MPALFPKSPISALEAMELAQWIAFAPFVFQATRCLRDRGLLAELERKKEGCTLAELREVAGLSEYATRVLMEAGLGIGLVTEDEQGRYHPTKVTHYMLHDDMTRANFDFTRDVNYHGLADLDAALETGKPVGLRTLGNWPTIYEALSELPEQISQSWFSFDHYYSDGAFPNAAPLVLGPKPKRLLDVGGNTGKWAITCLSADPELELTIMDLPGQLETASVALEAANLGGRVELLPANVLDENCTFPTGFDVIWMSQFLDCFSEPEITSILRRAAAAMGPETRLYILETFWDHQRFEVAQFCLQMTSLYFTALANGNSQMYRSTVFLECVREAGLVVETTHEGVGLSHTLLVCRKA